MSKNQLFMNAAQEGILNAAHGEYMVVSVKDIDAVSQSLRDFAENSYRHAVLIHDPAALALTEDLDKLYRLIREKHHERFIRYRGQGETTDELRHSVSRTMEDRLGMDVESAFPAVWQDLEQQVERLSQTFTDERTYQLAVCLHDGCLKNPKWHLDKHLPDNCIRSVRNVLATGPQFAVKDYFQEVHDGRNFEVEKSVQLYEGQSIFKPKADGGVVHRSPSASYPEQRRWSLIVTATTPKL